MATVTVTQILGSDNIAGSRITINDNFSRLASGINNLEARLNTSYNPGGSLNVGSALIKRYTNPTTTTIFTCEASGLFSGNLTISGILSSVGNASFSADLTVGGNATFNGSAGTGKVVEYTNVLVTRANASYNDENLWPTGSGSLVNPQDLTSPTTTSTARNLTASLIANLSTIQLDFSTYTGAGSTNCNELVLPDVNSVEQGRIITFVVNLPMPSGETDNMIISGLASFYTDDIILNGASDPDADICKTSVVTLFASQDGWKVLNSAGPVTYSL